MVITKTKISLIVPVTFGLVLFSEVFMVASAVTCNPPEQILHASFTPVLTEYDLNTQINYTCDLGYQYVSGVNETTCNESGVFPPTDINCTVITCVPDDIEHMSYTPMLTEHFWNTSITYTCDLGYRYISGVKETTCNESGVFPPVDIKCTEVTCGPPGQKVNAKYTPVFSTYGYNSIVTYQCNVGYHYVSGVFETSCNQNGVFDPQVDINCTEGQHVLGINVFEPAVTWLNATFTTVDTMFNIDDFCEVTISCSPDRFTVTSSVSENQLTLTLQAQPGVTTFDVYTCTLHASRGDMTFPDVHRTVFYGDSIQGFQVELAHHNVYVAVGEAYNFVARSTQGTNVSVAWQMEDDITITIAYPGELTYATLAYTFKRWKHNITAVGWNWVSVSEPATVYVEAVYKINNLNFTVVSELWNTTSPVKLNVHLLPTANVPMHQINITIDFNDGIVLTDSKIIDEFYPVDVDAFSFTHLFDTPGNISVNLSVANIVSNEYYSISMRIWDSLLPLQLDFVNALNVKYIATNETAEFSFKNVPRYGFQYTIDFGDKTPVETMVGDACLYSEYNHNVFSHIYTTEGVYVLHWTAKNGEPSYDRVETMKIYVQNKLPVDGFTLEPVGRKYPWFNLQSMSISVNITLDADVMLPTNATCTFTASDGTGSVSDLAFTSSFFEYRHYYLTEGTFNSSFDCSNDVSREIYMYNITVQKFRATYLDVIFNNYVPLNVSESVTVFFNITNDGFYLIPQNVYLTWQFGMTTLASVVYDRTTYSHDFNERGNITITLLVDAKTTITTNKLLYYLRLGWMYFSYNTTIQFINSTVNRYSMSGVDGSTTYTIYFDGSKIGNCTTLGGERCNIHRLCPQYGYHLVEVVASNATFMEIDNVNITCDNPLDNVSLDTPNTVAIPDGVIDAKLRIPADDLYIPEIFCEWTMGDPIKRKTYRPPAQTITFGVPAVFTFQYYALGMHTITSHCWNLINETTLYTKIIVTNKDFLFTGVFDRFYSQEDSPLYVSSMLDIDIISRLYINADFRNRTQTNEWYVNNTLQRYKRQGILFDREHFRNGLHYIKLTICFVEESANCIFEPTYVFSVMPPPHAEIVGSRRRYVRRGLVVVDAKSLSYDPQFPDINNLSYSWTCERYEATSFEDALDKYDLPYVYGSSCTTYDKTSGIITLDTRASTALSHYVIRLTVDNNRGGSSTFIQVSSITNQLPLSIKCKINCQSKVAVSSKLLLIPDLDNNCEGVFTWTLVKRSNVNDIMIDLDSISRNGATQRPLTIKENTLESGAWYLASVSATIGGKQYGPAYYEFATNRPPQGGFCRIVPYTAFNGSVLPIDIELENTTTNSTAYQTQAGIDIFNCTCEKWEDEGFTYDNFTSREPLFYLFYLTYGSNDSARQLGYFDPGQTSNLITFQVGDPFDNFKATVYLRITDVFGDYTEVSFKIISLPTVIDSQLANMSGAQVAGEIQQFIRQFEDQMIKANRTYDYRTISRKIMDIYSVLNILTAATASNTTLTPEDLLSLGNQKVGDKILGWSEYWKMIIENEEGALKYIIEAGEQYASMLYACTTSWPENTRMTLVAIETISRAFTAITAKTDYSNVTVTVLGGRIVNILATYLAKLSDERTFPNTGQLYAAGKSVFGVVRNCLAILQPVLTPNLPQDPTADEMRRYLEYIKIFTTSEDAQASLLSLQEQTFLAQKQLQKYYLSKFIKIEASKNTIPNLKYALQNLTYVLGHLTQIGQDEESFENDYIFISVSKKPANEIVGKTHSSKSGVAMTFDSIREKYDCNSREIMLRKIRRLLGKLSWKMIIRVIDLTTYDVGNMNKRAMMALYHSPEYNKVVLYKTQRLDMTVVFKKNPYFWGNFADRITSVVPMWVMDGATIDSNKIIFRLENKVEASCTDTIPTYEEDDPDKIFYILFDRQHAADDILIFVRPNTTELVYKLYFNKDVKPDITNGKFTYTKEMKNNDGTWTPDDGYKLLIKANEYSETGKIWIALKPIIDESNDTSLLTRMFCANVTSVNCLAWKNDSNGEYFWDKDICSVSLTSTRRQTVCICDNLGDTSAMTVGTTFYVPYNIIDFAAVHATSDTTGRGPVIGMIIASVVLYCLLVVWAWREDVKDQYKWSLSLLIDNDIADRYFYIVRVYTGLRTGAGTTSNIGFMLVGEYDDTDIRILDDESHIGFERGSVRTFVMSTKRNLGELLSMRIWHDDTGGPGTSWYLNKINITDLTNGMRYIFMCDKWFHYDIGDTRVDRVLKAQIYDDVRSYQEMISYTLIDQHLWLSIFTRPMKSQFTRVQRLSCILGFVFLTMIICTMTIKTPKEYKTLSQVVIGPFRFSMDNFINAMVAAAVSTVIIQIVSVLFKYAENEDGYPNIDSMLRNVYRKVNEKLKFDSSVLARRYWSPAEAALSYNCFFLPHFFVYIGWAVLVVIIGLSAYLIMSSSTHWYVVQSAEWMTAIVVAILCSVLVIEGIKIIIILIFFSLLCQRAYEPPEPYIDKIRLEEITRYNSATLTIGPHFRSVLHKPEIPSEETLVQNKIQRIRNHQLLKILSQLLMYIAVLYLVYTISYESRDPRSFYLKDHLEKLFGFTEEVSDLESFTEWLNGRFTDTYFSTNFFGAEYKAKDVDEQLHNKFFMQDLTSFRVGPARLRQLRVREDVCLGPLAGNKSCHYQFEESTMETKDFCLGWTPAPCHVSQNSRYFSSPAWKYTSADDVWGFPTVATYRTYGAGGYFMKLDVNKFVSLKIFDELFQWLWFDDRTRAVILEFTLYNANSNLFMYTKYVAEFPEVGGFLPYVEMQVFRLYTHNGPDGQYILYLEFIFLVLVVSATFYCIHEILTDARNFLKSFWNILDLVSLAMGYTTIAIFIYKIFVINKTIEQFHNDMNAYVGFENLPFYDFIGNTTYGALVFLLSLRVSRILGYSGKINEMAGVISNASSDLFGFLFTFSIIQIAFVTSGCILFGREQDIYRNLFQTTSTLTQATVGRNRVMEIITTKPVYAEVYYFAFYLFVLMTLATMAAAILNFSITKVKEDAIELAPTNIVEVIADRLGKLLHKLIPRERSKTGNKKKGDRKGSDAELIDIFEDLRIFVTDFKARRMKKIGNKYKLIDVESRQ